MRRSEKEESRLIMDYAVSSYSPWQPAVIKQGQIRVYIATTTYMSRGKNRLGVYSEDWGVVEDDSTSSAVTRDRVPLKESQMVGCCIETLASIHVEVEVEVNMAQKMVHYYLYQEN